MKLGAVERANKFNEYENSIKTKFKRRDVNYGYIARKSKALFEILQRRCPIVEVPTTCLTGHRELLTHNHYIDVDLPHGAEYFLDLVNTEPYKHLLYEVLPLLNGKALKKIALSYCTVYGYETSILEGNENLDIYKKSNVFDIICHKGDRWAQAIADLQKLECKKMDMYYYQKFKIFSIAFVTSGILTCIVKFMDYCSSELFQHMVFSVITANQVAMILFSIASLSFVMICLLFFIYDSGKF